MGVGDLYIHPIPLTSMAPPNQEQCKLTCSEILEIGVDNFLDFPLHVRLTTLVIPIGILFIIIGISSNSWSHSDSDNIGLWKYCSTFSYIECCESITDFLGREPPGMIFYLYVHFTEFKTRVTRGAGTAFPSGAPVFLVGSVLLDHYFMCNIF